MLKNIKNYIIESNFKVSYFNNKIDIINYENIVHFDNNKIIIRHKNGSVTVNGKDLIISRLMKDEVLISGLIKRVDYD